MNKSITIHIDKMNEVMKNPNDGIATPEIRFQVLGEFDDSEFVGILGNAYQQAVQVFLETHPCKDCPAYLQHSYSTKALTEIKKKIFEKLNE